MKVPMHAIRLAGSDTTFACAADDTVLRAAQRAGLAFPYECNVGSCGNCKFELLDDEVATAWAAALATTLGLALPALVFPVLVSRASRLPQFERGLKALQHGLSPVALGLMAATCYLLVREAPGAGKGAAMIVVSLLLSLAKLPPLMLIAAAGIVGAWVSW